jgi:hypothetical protein
MPSAQRREAHLRPPRGRQAWRSLRHEGVTCVSPGAGYGASDFPGVDRVTGGTTRRVAVTNGLQELSAVCLRGRRRSGPSGVAGPEVVAC